MIAARWLLLVVLLVGASAYAGNTLNHQYVGGVNGTRAADTDHVTVRVSVGPNVANGTYSLWFRKNKTLNGVLQAAGDNYFTVTVTEGNRGGDVMHNGSPFDWSATEEGGGYTTIGHYPLRADIPNVGNSGYVVSGSYVDTLTNSQPATAQPTKAFQGYWDVHIGSGSPPKTFRLLGTIVNNSEYNYTAELRDVPGAVYLKPIPAGGTETFDWSTRLFAPGYTGTAGNGAFTGKVVPFPWSIVYVGPGDLGESTEQSGTVESHTEDITVDVSQVIAASEPEPEPVIPPDPSEPAGTTTVTNPDGTVTKTYADGSVSTTMGANANGDTGTTTTKTESGSTTTTRVVRSGGGSGADPNAPKLTNTTTTTALSNGSATTVTKQDFYEAVRQGVLDASRTATGTTGTGTGVSGGGSGSSAGLPAKTLTALEGFDSEKGKLNDVGGKVDTALSKVGDVKAGFAGKLGSVTTLNSLPSSIGTVASLDFGTVNLGVSTLDLDIDFTGPVGSKVALIRSCFLWAMSIGFVVLSVQVFKGYV
jgi:hypothetical protein